MRAATASYPLDRLESWDQFRKKEDEWVSEAAGQGAELLVFPEYGAMELAALGGRNDTTDLQGSIEAVAAVSGQAIEIWCEIAARQNVHILAPSFPVFDPGPRPVNRACLIGPGGMIGFQDKQVMTRFEREEMDVVPGGALKVFDTPLGKIGILICYDAEFPLLGRALAEAGAEIILAPSCTETLAGYTRVRVGAMARALENQCVVIHSPTVGSADWCLVADENTGAAAIYGPPDRGFPATGVLAEGKLNHPGWVFADVDREAIAEVRRDGRVLNKAHWPESVARSHIDLP